MEEIVPKETMQLGSKAGIEKSFWGSKSKSLKKENLMRCDKYVKG